MARIAVIGTGYVGLITAACFADLGNEVAAIDIDEKKIARLQNGEAIIHENGLEELLQKTTSNNKLQFSTNASDTIAGRDFVFLCVPTPSAEDGSVDLSFLQRASSGIADALSPGTVVVNKSTVPVGSTRVVENILQRGDVTVVSNPEFLREGTAITDFMHPDRVVIGGDNREACEKVATLYQGLNTEILITDPASAETIKYGANAFLATKISFANALANLCEEIGANVNDVIRGIGLDKRIGSSAMHPGPGWGGSCFPKDTSALLSMARDVGYDFVLLQGVIAVNDYQRERVIEKTKRVVGGTLLGRKIAVWGLTFKSGTDDLRESPAIAITKQLCERGAEVYAFDPTMPTSVDGITIVSDMYECTDRAEALLVLTEWNEFAEADLNKVKQLMRSPRIVDARNIVDAKQARNQGFTYVGIGGV
jgi:UDPglucose 6-dehydrogenase